jgi:hypothetical protein
MAKVALDRACTVCGGKVWYVYPEKRSASRCVACAHEYANISHAHRRALVKKIAEYEEVLEIIASPARDRAAVQQLAIKVLEKFR